MVRFSDLKKAELEAKPQKTDRVKKKEVPQNSRFSFRQLESEKEQALSESDHPSTEAPEENREALYIEAADYLTQVFDAIRQRKTFALEKGIQIIEKMVAVQPAIDSLFIKAIHYDERINFWTNHCVNVAIFAIKMAENIGFSKDKQVEIGLAGLLHEVGMGVIPESVIFKKEKLSDQEYKIFKDRPKYAYKILHGFKGRYSYLAECALQVYEKIDGSGYPRGLKGEEIHEYALIIGLVDTYEALIHSRPQREKFLHFSAVKEIIKTGKGHYKKEHLKALLNLFSIFPPYSYVRLNSSAIGQVIETYPDQPMRPKLRIIHDSLGKKVLTDRIVNLTENSLLYIVDAISHEELHTLSPASEKLFPPSEEGEHETDLSVAEKPVESRPEKPKTSQPLKDSARLQDRVKMLSGYRPFLISIIFVILVALVFGFFRMLKKDSESIQTDIPQKNVLSKKIVNVPPAETPDVSVPPMVSDVSRNVMISQEEYKESRTPELMEAEQNSGQSVEEPEEAEFRNEPLKSVPDTGDAAVYPYSILLASFRDNEKAKKVVTALRKRGLSSYWVKVDLESRGLWYRVFAGYFKDFQEAENQIRQKDLNNASVKKTQFSVLIGTYSSEDAVRPKIRSINELGYAPYVILKGNGEFYLYVGAFYTKQGAENQCLDLISKGVPCKVAER